MNKCDICGKTEKFEGLVWYNMKMPSTNLCRSHYTKWNYEHREYKKEHYYVKPCTIAWDNMCNEEAKLFMKWFNKQTSHYGGG